MREILFRGKSKDSDEWVEGDFCRPCNICFETIGEDPVIDQSDIPVWNDYAVIPETVGQYTGLTDKNGKRIFEGDIIKDLGGSMDGIPRVVMWNEVWMEFETYLVKRHWAYGINNSRLWCMRDREIEVIGNIYDNPELLRGGNGEDS